MQIKSKITENKIINWISICVPRFVLCLWFQLRQVIWGSIDSTANDKLPALWSFPAASSQKLWSAVFTQTGTTRSIDDLANNYTVTYETEVNWNMHSEFNVRLLCDWHWQSTQTRFTGKQKPIFDFLSVINCDLYDLCFISIVTIERKQSNNLESIHARSHCRLQ